MSARTFSLSMEGLHVARRLSGLAATRPLALDSLVFDRYSSYWREILSALHRHGGRGQGERIAIVDSGCAGAPAAARRVDRAASLDLTGEGLADGVGHGSAIDALIGLVAPRAEIVHVKLYDRSGRIPGHRYDDQVTLIARAFDHLARANVTVVNVSWNYLTLIDEHPTDVRPGHFCRCPICAVFERFVEATSADVFVSEGNFTYADGDASGRPTGSWSCPAAAELVIPVLGYQDGKPRYNANLDTTAAIPAACDIGLPALAGEPPVSLTGSSFATPLVAATYAAMRSAFRANGFDRFSLPRSHETETSATSEFTFPFAQFFASPADESPAMREWHTYWYVVIHNCMTAARHEAAAGHYDNAGQLSRLLGDVLDVSYRRMAAWESWVNIAGGILELYLNAVVWLHQSNLASTAFDVLENARAVMRLARERGVDLSEFEPALADLTAEHRRRSLEFLARLEL